MQDILNSSQAARVIGCGPQKVRERIKRGIWTFGTIVTAKEAGNTHKILMKSISISWQRI